MHQSSGSLGQIRNDMEFNPKYSSFVNRIFFGWAILLLGRTFFIILYFCIEKYVPKVKPPERYLLWVDTIIMLLWPVPLIIGCVYHYLIWIKGRKRCKFFISFYITWLILFLSAICLTIYPVVLLYALIVCCNSNPTYDDIDHLAKQSFLIPLVMGSWGHLIGIELMGVIGIMVVLRMISKYRREKRRDTCTCDTHLNK